MPAQARKVSARLPAGAGVTVSPNTVRQFAPRGPKSASGPSLADLRFRLHPARSGGA